MHLMSNWQILFFRHVGEPLMPHLTWLLCFVLRLHVFGVLTICGCPIRRGSAIYSFDF